MALKVTLAVALLAALCTGQQLQGNYVDDYQDYQDVPQRAAPPPPRPAPQRHAAVHSSSSNVPRPTPVPILKQINRHNEDGSYTYGYEGADGTFKIETKFPTGDVKGKYGFVDDTGKVRVVEYGADRYGFQPAGEGITVAPPTLVDETTREDEEVERPRPRPSAPARFENRPPPPPPPRYESRPAPAPAPAPARFDSFEVQSRFQDEPRFAPRPKSPTPPRPLVVPGAAPVGSPSPQRPLLVPGASPVPQSRPAPRPQPQVSRAFQPAQQFGPQQFAGPIVQQPVRQQQSGGILDQLAKDYALPKGAGTPLHDISFGYY